MTTATGPGPAVLEVLTKTPNTVRSVADITGDLDGALTRAQVAGALRNMARTRAEVVAMGDGKFMFLPKLAFTASEGNRRRRINPRGGPDAEDGDEGAEVHIAMEPSLDEAGAVIAALPSTAKGCPSEVRKSPEVAIETISPETATMWLSANTKNRDLRLSRVVWLTGIINRGEWQLTTDGIGFDTQGFLRNGQHRLSSIVVAGRAVPLVVVRGLKPKAQDVMDRMLPRSMSDALKLRGESYTAQTASALTWLYRLEYVETTGQVHYRNSGERPTTPQLLGLLDEHPGLRDAVRDVARGLSRTEVPVRTGAFSALLYRFRSKHREEADLFFERFFDGTNLASDDAIHVLRRLLISDVKRSYERMPDYREVALVIKAWNAWLEQKPTDRLTYKYSPTVKEPFPPIT